MKVEYLEDSHVYLVEGKIVLSVTQILSTIFPNKYKGIPEFILKNKAIYGSKIHETIEMYEINKQVMQEDEAYTIAIMDLDYIQDASFNQYLKIKKEHQIQVIDQEQIINYKDIYAGRYDMSATVNGKYSLIDIKTTAELDLEYLSWQLSLYDYPNKKRHDKLFALWLPKRDLGKLVEIPRKSDKEIEELLERFRNE